ncbi:kinase-like domain-containing protein [Cristinia sonorae]|uniref:Kinase-like domain-containing protein n=1 Tax=Cristinia sonorae TaxID=1940300 RepID=A0A8K0V135_9AGAR|nr:kinase-like domain-containing protein [Cristinia sonorae]
MAAVINAALDIAQGAAELSGVPYLATSIGLVKCIKDNCDRIYVRKAECQQLANKASQLIATFEEQTSRLQGSQLQEYADQLEAILMKINTRTNKWSRYSFVHAFWRDDKIADGIKQCMDDMDAGLASFHVNADVVLNHNQEQMRLMLLNHTDNLEHILHILTNNDEVRQVVALQRAGAPVAERVMDVGKRQLQILREKEGDPSRPVQSETYRQMERGMSQLYSMTGIPPTVRNLNGEITRPDDIPYVGGVYSDVWIGYWLGDQKVALKTMRGVAIPPEKAQKRFEREINVWSKLSHPHVLPFLGIVTNIGHFTHMVSPWQSNGNILEYVKFVDLDVQSLQQPLQLHQEVRTSRPVAPGRAYFSPCPVIHDLTEVQLAGAGEGLAYLHSQGVIHGNVRCANILVAIGGEAVICDFGMAKIREETSAQSATMTLTAQGSARWMSPELLDATISSPNQQCDVYSFAMTMLECFTLKEPFVEIKREIHVITKMSKGILKPKRPELDSPAAKWISDDLWALMEECWHRDVHKRPETKVVASRLRGIEMDVRRSRSGFSSATTPPPSFIQMPAPSVAMPVPAVHSPHSFSSSMAASLDSTTPSRVATPPAIES